MTELTVAAALLLSILTAVTPLAVRGGRIRQETRRYLAALDELSNQLDRLTALERSRLPGALDQLAPSPFACRVLPSPELSAEMIDDEDGRRLILRLSWARPGNAQPLTMVGWLAPPASAYGETTP